MKLNLAARAGRWSAAHWKTATFGWLAFVLVAVVLGGAIGTKQLNQNATGPGESGRMAKILDEEFKQPAGETVLIQSRALTAKDPAFKAGIEDVARRISAVPVATNVRNPLEPANSDQISDDGHAAIVQFDIRGDPDDAADKVDPLLAAVDDAKAANPALTIGEFGEASAQKDIMDRVGQDLGRAGLLSIPVTLVILLVAFGALVAAGIPLLLALSAVAATMGLLAVPSHIWPVDESVSAVVLLIGLAVGVDYSLFYLKREREERARGRSESAALAGRRRDLRAVGAHLRAHGHDRDGRNVPDRRRGLQLVRNGDHAGRGDRRARLANGPAGAAFQARRPREQGAHPAPPPAAEAGGRAHLGRDPRSGPPPPGRLGRRVRGRAPGPRCTARDDQDSHAGRRGAAEGPDGDPGLRPPPGCLPG